MNLANKRQPLSVAEYLAGEPNSDVKYEYVSGKVYATAGANNAHNRLASRVLVALGKQLNRPCEVFNSDTKVHVEIKQSHFFYYPDAMIVCEPNDDEDTFQDRPIVLLEVLSDSTRRTDEGEKRDRYLSIPTLQSYVLLETDQPAARVFERTSDGTFSETIYDNLLSEIPLPSINGHLSLADLYS